MAEAFLAAALVGLLCTVAALAPPDRPAPLVGIAFFPSLVFSELAPQLLVLHVVITAALTPWALGSTPGRAGLVLAGLTAAGLAWLVGRQVRAWRNRPGLDGPRLARSAALTAMPVRPRDVERLADLVYCHRGDRPLHVDVYRRRDHRGGAPILVQVHGGAWIVGRKEDQALPLMHLLARRGWVCVSVQYRLSPRATFPDHLIDVKEGLAWVRRHAADLGGDPDRIVLTGGSAGGHLASLAALTPGHWQPGFEGDDTSVRACLPWYGVYDFTDRAGHWRGRGLDRLLTRQVMKVALADAEHRYHEASPMSRTGAHAPPFLLVHGTADTLVPLAEARLFADTLRQVSDRPVDLLEVPHAQHAFDVVASPRTRAVLQRVVAWCEACVGPPAS